MSEILSVNNLTLSYGSFTALDGLNMSVAKNEIVGLIGPNGAGKTSFIKALCGRIKVQSGTIEIDGTVVKASQSRQELIGLVPQDIGLYSHMTAKENLHTFSKIMNISGSESRKAVETALQAVDMTDKGDVRISALSGGMKRRINVAAAIMHKPKLIILDEPTAGVDIPARDSIHRLARQLAKSDMAVLLVTHELEQAEALCDRILLLADGKKLAEGPPADILTKCYKGSREVMIRFATPPTDEILSTLKPFKFHQGELPTIWTALTDVN